VTTFLQIFSNINIALHSMGMGPPKGAKVATNDSTLGDPAAEEPPMKLSLGYPKTKKLSASGGRVGFAH